MAASSAHASAEEMEGLLTEFQPSVLLTHSRTLFLRGDGSPILFYLAPGPWKRLLAPLILHGGGSICRFRAPGAILLAPPGQGSPLGPETYISALFVTDCVRAGQLLDVEPYRLGPPSRPKVPCCYHELASGPHASGRTPFTRGEDIAILMYLRDHLDPGATATGNSVWKEMDRVHLTRHSWQAMQARYLKTLRGHEGAYQLEARTLIPTLVYPHCGTCRPSRWPRRGEGKCEHSGVEPSARDPQEVSSTLNHSEGHRFRQPQGGQGSKDHWAGKGSKERGKAARFMEGKEMGSRGEALSSEDGPNTDQLLEGETSRDSMKEKNTPDHLEEEMAVCSPQKRKPAERTQDNTRELVPRTKQMGAEPIGDFLESNACSLDVGENLELLNRGQVAMNVQDSPFEIFEQGCPSESDFITPTLYKRKSARLGCLNKSVVGEDEIGVIRMCDDQAIVASVAGVDDDKCSISCTGDRELCAPLVSAIGNPPQFEKAEYSEGYQASVVGDIDSGMFSALDRSEPLDENADKDGTGISGITSVNRALQSCASPRAELEERGITAEEEYNHSLNLLKRVDESMESSDDNFTTKRRKHAPECDTEDLQVIKDSGPIGQRKNGWHNDLECREDEELQIKRKMKSAPVKGNLGIFDKANQEFQVEDYTPDLVVLNVEQNITYHGDPPSPTKQISVSKKPASHEYSGVSELEEESTEKSTQCSRSPEIQVLKKLSVTKNSNMLERQPKKNDHLGGSPKLYGTRPVLQLNQFVCCDDSQIDEYSTRLEESSTQLETEHSSPTDSQMEVDKVRKNIQSLMKEFNLNLGTVTQAFLKNNGELEATKYFLKNGARPDGYPIWTQQDDLQLINEDDENKIHLIKKFGTHNVKRRIEFLKS